MFPPISEDKQVWPHLVVRGARAKPRADKELPLICGVGASDQYTCHNTNFTTLARGLMTRMFFVKKDGKYVPPPVPTEGIYQSTLAYVADAIVKHCPYVNPVKMEEFPLLYQARKRTVYTKAVASLQINPVCHDDAICKTFSKVEKINFTAKPEADPRNIYPRDPRYVVATGVFIKPMEAIIIKAIAHLYNSPTVVKGMNANEVGQLAYNKWCKFNNPVAVGLDASRFDQHVSKEALEFEHGIYVKLLARKEDRRVLKRLLEWQLMNRGRVYIDDKKISYGVIGRRCSGDINTGLGNCILCCVLIYHYIKSKNITKYEVLNNGDDCVLIVEKEDLHKVNDFHDFMVPYGFNFVVEKPEFELANIEFCQSRFLPTSDGWRQIRNPKTAINKDAVSIKPFQNENVFRAWLGAVGEGGLALNSGIPVLQEFYRCYGRESHGIKRNLSDDPTMQTGTRFLTRGMIAKVSEVLPETRYHFWLATGMLPAEQLALEEYYRNLTIAYSGPGSEPLVTLLL